MKVDVIVFDVQKTSGEEYLLEDFPEPEKPESELPKPEELPVEEDELNGYENKHTLQE